MSRSQRRSLRAEQATARSEAPVSPTDGRLMQASLKLVLHKRSFRFETVRNTLPPPLSRA